jgi:hypothetical protein
MKYKVEFQHKSKGSTRPGDEVQEEEILFEKGEFIPIPDVGDTVSLMWGNDQKEFKVLTRHFSYLMNWCVVNIVVTDVSDGEMAARLKM